MKKTILTTAFAFTVLFASAQLKVFTTGKVAAGSTTTPNQSLDVTGDISLVSATNSFRINNNIILRHKGITTDIFLGLGAGNSITTGANNTFIGYNAGFSSTTGASAVAIGANALYSNTAFGSIGIGSSALYSNAAGTANVAIGVSALTVNSTGSYNTACGYQVLIANNGSINTAVGTWALNANTTGNSNSAFGMKALYSNTSGNNNTSTGVESLNLNTTGYNNTSCGYRALITNTTGYNNTAIGYLANVSNAALNNATAIGYNASTTATNMMYLGNANALLYCATGVWTGSDGRFKTNVTENVKGLEFINKLRPVTYNMNTSVLDDFQIQNLPDSIKTLHKAGMDFVASTAIVHSGFIAQEVEQASQQVGFTSSIVHAPDNDNTHYALNYAEIVVPLVKAVQELNKIADSLQTKTTMKDSINTAVQSAQQQKIDNLETQKHSQDSVNVSLQIQLNQLLSNINSCCVINGVRSNTQSQSSTQQIDVKLNDAQTIVLEQNVPNPFAEQTAINYSLPENTVKAQMLFYNAQGKLIQSTELTQKGEGTLNVFANDLSSGIYTYTLVVDGKIIETKKMVKQ